MNNMTLALTLIFAFGLFTEPATAATRKQVAKVREQPASGLDGRELLVKRRLLEPDEFEVIYSNGISCITSWNRYDRDAGSFWWLDLEAIPVAEYDSDEDVDSTVPAHHESLLAELEARLARLREPFRH